MINKKKEVIYYLWGIDIDMNIRHDTDTDKIEAKKGKWNLP
jgi:hypothetical protein